jgi:hypothetical protein
MAKKQAASKSKSVAIREYKAKNPYARPKEIADILGQQGVAVTPALVSTILSADRKRSNRRALSRPASVEQLLLAKRLADELGGLDEARNALDALAKLLS